MEPGRYSVTAEMIAYQRALHQVLDRPLVFEDPIVARLLDADEQRKLAVAGSEPRTPGPWRAMAAARSRFCEDALAAAILERDALQYVILGAGLDTFAYRSPLGARIRVFEVDFPATQSLKRDRLLEAGIPEPQSITYVPLDLEQTSLLNVLVAAGVKTNQPTFFGVLGVIAYLSAETILEMFGTVATAFPRGSEIAFDYGVSPDLLPERARQVQAAWRQRVETSAEPVLSFTIPSALRPTLFRTGFRDVEQLDTAAINGRYFYARDDGLRAGPAWGLARAAV
jgi:methyltransferase (TIGR00027 family)